MVVVLLWPQNWRENLVGVVHSLNHQQGCLRVIPLSNLHLNDHPADQLESKTKRNWHRREHPYHVIGTEKQIKGQKELEARDPQDLLDSERRSLSKRERAPNLRHPEGIDEEDQVVGGAMLGIDRDEGNDDEHVEADKEAGQLLLVLQIVVCVDFGVVGSPNDEEHPHFDHRKEEKFVERNEIKRGEEA